MKAAISGALALTGLLGIYFTVSILISGVEFSLSQFKAYWPYFSVLSLGFAVQVSLFMLIREKVKQGSAKMVAATGGTSGLAMISCCSHYLVNLLPLIGISALVSFVAHYQIEIFWAAILLNILGIFIMYRRYRSINPAPLNSGLGFKKKKEGAR